jgi:multiple sugar transport system substrate-binding protein/sn-glycerol 3-phosphate transport system substrate-binding protein
MKWARNRAWAGVVSAGLAAWVVGWAGGAAAAPVSPATPPAIDLSKVDPRGQKVVFWHHYTRERKETLARIIDEYNRTNPYGIQVQAEFMGTHKDIYGKVLAAVQQGSLPQLVDAYHNQAREYYKLGAVTDLSPFMYSAAWGLPDVVRKDYIEELLTGDNFQGVQVAFRPHFSVELLYYNRDWLTELGYAKPPQNWSEFTQMCRKAKAQPFSRSPDPGRSLGFMLEEDASRLASMVFSRGGDFANPEGTGYVFDTPAVKTSLSMLRQLLRDGAVEVFREPYADRRAFSTGQVLFAMRSSSGLLAFKTDIESGLDFDWDLAPVPYEGPAPVNNVYGSSVSVCGSTPERELASWLFLKWFTEPYQQTRWVQGSIYFAVRKSAVQEYEPYFRRTYTFLGTGKSEPALPRYEEVRKLVVKAMVGIVNGEDMDKTLARLQWEANQTPTK